MILTRLLKTAVAVLVAAVGFATAGCIQMEDKTVLAKDGSGTAEVNVVFDLSKIEAITEMFKGFTGGGEPGAEDEAPPKEAKDDGFTSEYSEEKIREKLKAHPGVELVKHTSEKKDGKHAIRMEFRFKDFADFAKADICKNKGVELVKNENGSFTLKYDPQAGQADKMGGGQPAKGEPGKGEPGMDEPGMGEPAMDEPDPMGGDAAMMLPMLEPFLGSLEVKTKITLPGTITETNGTKDGESSVSWVLNWKSMMESMTNKKPALWSVTFQGEGIALKPFKFTPDAEAMAKQFGGPK